MNNEYRKLTISILLILLAPALLVIYFVNYQTLLASYHHYWGLNYYLNGLVNLSAKSWEKALTALNPYIDGTRQDYATNLQQSYTVGVYFEPIAETHRRGIEEIKKTIANQPENYFFYKFLAEHYNIFQGFDPSYLVESEKYAAKAWELSPNRQEILYTMAKTALLKGETDKGYELFQKATELHVNAGDPHFYFGLLAFERGDSKKGFEEIALARKLGREPKTLQEAILLGNYVGDAGDYGLAIEIYKKALKERAGELLPDFPQRALDLKLKIAIAYYFNGDRESSRQAFLDLLKEVDIKKTPIYETLKPVFKELGI